MSDIVRFEQKYEVLDTGCWQWIGAMRPNGYGAFWYEGRVQQAHRAAYLMHRGEFDRALDLDHLCRNRGCVNPAHVEPVTRSENNRRGRRGYGARTTCMSGQHDITASDTYYVWNNGSRTCKECAKDAARRGARRAQIRKALDEHRS